MKNSIDSAWHDNQIKLYAKKQKHYKKYADLLEKILKAACWTHAPQAIVQVRAKKLSSFAEKAIRKAGKYSDPVHQFTDLCGARVITQTQVEVDRISRFIIHNFDIDVANSIDQRSALGVSEFGYLSVHYIVQLKEQESGMIEGIPLPKDLVNGGFKAEIQVRTLLQHAWAGISHDSLYKNMFKPPDSWKRDMNRIAATLEEADQSFARFISRLDAYAANHGSYLPQKKRQEEINTLKRILEKEPMPDEKFRHALRIAGIFRAVEDWGGAIEALTPFEAGADFMVLRELGYALCRLSRQNPKSQEYQKGVRLLDKARAINDDDAQVHACLAWVLKNSQRAEESRRVQEHLAKAFQKQPGNPYYLAAYLESEIISRQTLFHIALMRPTLLKAIDTCQAHVDAGIELPMAFFTMGRFHLYLNRPDAGLLAYLEGLRLCLSDQSPAQFELIEDEIEFFYCVEELKEGLSGYEAALRLLIIARFVKTGCRENENEAVLQHREEALKSLNSIATKDISYKFPITVMVGSCAPAEEIHMKQFQELLERAFMPISGTVISGGTRNGVGGLIGDLIEKKGKNKSSNSPKLVAMTYLPGSLPLHSQPDPRYHRHIPTQGKDFSPLEPLQMWIDLLAAKIDPRQVKLLGIGGGVISAFEYRLALTLGAQVGIIQGSGREADAILNNPAWNTSGNLLPLARDRMTIRLFFTDPVPVIDPGLIEKMARNAHEAYRTERKKALSKSPSKEPNLQPWENLLPDFQNSNRQQAAFSVEILEQAGFKVEAASSGENFTDPVFTPDEIEYMAEMEHGRWNVERLRSGWRFGPEKNESAKISPYLIPWQDLSPEIKKYDREAVCNFPMLLWGAGLKIVRRKEALD